MDSFFKPENENMINLKALRTNAEQLVDIAKKAGADACDVAVLRNRSNGVQVRLGKIEDMTSSESDDFSLRVFVGARVASISANMETEFTELAERAVAMAKVSPDDPFAGLGDPERLARDFPELDLADPVPPNPDHMCERAMACESAAMEVAGVTNSMGAVVESSLSGFVLATSQGFSGSYAVTRHGCSASIIAGEGTSMERDYDYDQSNHLTDLRTPEDIGKSAGERTVRRLGAKQIKSGPATIILEPRLASGLLKNLASAINGISIARKTSFLRERMGQKILPEGITITDDPGIKRGIGSCPFDGEGLKTEKIEFITNGILNEWILDGATARELRLRCNARAERGGSGTFPSTTNFYMKPGTVTHKALIASVGQGLYVTEMIGHGINMITGDYSRGASGFWIENGEISFPVSEITIAGNLVSMFAHLTPASDLMFRYATNAPTLAIEGMMIAGK